MKQMTINEQIEVMIVQYGLGPGCPLYAQAGPNDVPHRVVGFSLVRDEQGGIHGLNFITETSEPS